jgi:periplasmic protein TonB
MTTDNFDSDNGFHQIVFGAIVSSICHVIILSFLMFHTYSPEPITAIAAIHVNIISRPASLPGPSKNNQGGQSLKKIEPPKQPDIIPVAKPPAPNPSKKKTRPKATLKNKIIKIGKEIKKEEKEKEKPITDAPTGISPSPGSVPESVNINTTDAGKGSGNGPGNGSGKDPVSSGPGNDGRQIIPLERTSPVYPMRARRMGIEGWVKVKILISEQGEVEKVDVLEARPKDIFEKSVLQGVALWRFSPAIVDGVPVKAFATTIIRFNLDDLK